MHAKLFLLLVGFALVASQTFGQKNYIVLAKGDTIKGQVKILSIDNLDRTQINTGQKKFTYTALQVKSIYKDNVTYHSVRLDNSFLFMQLLKSGYLSIYAFNTSGQSQWDGSYLLKKDGSGMEVPNLAFKKYLSKYLNDCPEIANRVAKGEFSRSDIDKVVDLYNECIQTKTGVVMKANSATAYSGEKIIAISKLAEKVEATQNFLTKNDVTDLLKDIKAKVLSNQPVPHYLTEGLKSYLADTPDLLKEAEDLITLLKK